MTSGHKLWAIIIKKSFNRSAFSKKRTSLWNNFENYKTFVWKASESFGDLCFKSGYQKILS